MVHVTKTTGRILYRFQPRRSRRPVWLHLSDERVLVLTVSGVDRGIYCLLIVALLLDLLTPELVTGTAAFIASCQTYEGGFSSASRPYFSSGILAAQRPSLGEAHGGYTFCALASWVLLQPYISADEDAPRVDLRRLLRWLVHMQGLEIELGGFKGRTNKLVDGCYSWWVGGAFALLEALGISPSIPAPASAQEGKKAGPPENGWDDADGASYKSANVSFTCSW